MNFDLQRGKKFDPCDLLPGDHLLYGPGYSIVEHIVCIKTWCWVCHIEIYIGGGRSIASRNMIGVGQYPLRLAQLAYVLRPVSFSPPNVEAVMEWFKTVDGEGYDFLGLMCFFLAVKRGSLDRMFCSEFACRADRPMAINSFARHWDADKVAPGNFLMSPAFEII